MYQTVISNGTVVTAAAAFQADVGISGERIAAVGLGLRGEKQIDASGCYVIPGGVDPHVHLQMRVGQYTSSDTFASGTEAAACGGTTTVVDFVEPEGNESMLEALDKRRSEADGQVVVDYGLHMTIPAWHADHALDQIPQVMEAGIYSFKMYQAYGPLCLNDTRLYAALRVLGSLDALPILHSENGPMIDQLREEALAAGHTDPIWHARTRPSRLEGEAVGRALDIAHQAGSKLYIVHVSCLESLQRIDAARQRGQNALCETCPQYLFLTDDKLKAPKGELYICSPPLRKARDNDVLAGALSRGVIEVVSTDHCPFMAAEKAAQVGFTQIPGGVPSVEARLGLVHELARRGSLSLSGWVNTCCTAPARIFRLPGKGHIAPGFDADIVVFDPHRIVVLSAEWLHEKVDWSPYEGIKLNGWPRDVFNRGAWVVRDGEFVGRTGRGRFLQAGYGEKSITG